jgi:hypothetical protein
MLGVREMVIHMYTAPGLFKNLSKTIFFELSKLYLQADEWFERLSDSGAEQ